MGTWFSAVKQIKRNRARARRKRRAEKRRVERGRRLSTGWVSKPYLVEEYQEMERKNCGLDRQE